VVGVQDDHMEPDGLSSWSSHTDTLTAFLSVWTHPAGNECSYLQLQQDTKFAVTARHKI